MLWMGCTFVDVFLGKSHQLVFGDRYPIDQLNKSARHFAGMLIRLPNSASKSHGVMSGKRLFNLGGVDVVAATKKQILGTNGDP